MQSYEKVVHPSSGETPKRSTKRRNLLNIAAQMMNRDGAASITLGAVAARTGMTRNALYYYYRDKDSLIYSCYVAGAEHLAETARSAIEQRGCVTERLRSFLQRLMTSEQHFAILNDLDLLPPPRADEIRAIQERALQHVKTLFAEGINEGALRDVNSNTAAHVLLGMADWARLWRTWTAPTEDNALAIEHQSASCEAILRTVLGGFALLHQAPTSPPDVGRLITANTNVLDRKSLADQKRITLVGIASQLFNRRGIAATSIDDISDAAGATKGLIYHHFDSKAALVEACYDRAFDIYELFAETAEAESGIGSIESLTWPMHLSAQALISRTPPLMLQTGVSVLSKRHRERAIALARRFENDMAVAIENGIAETSSMPFTQLSAGAFFWIPRWHAEAEAIGDYRLGDEIVDLLTRGARKNLQT